VLKSKVDIYFVQLLKSVFKKHYFLLWFVIKGSRKNKFTFLGVEAPVWQGAQAQEYRDISALGQHRRAECIGA
jgi:hypothetical protein